MAQPPRSRLQTRPTGPPKPRVPMLLMQAWDAPTRLFLWSAVLLFAVSYVAAEQEWPQLHFLSGYVLLA